MIKIDETCEWKRNLKWFVCGSFGGVVATLFTHPFDLIRARMAFSRTDRYKKIKIWKFTKLMIKKEGISVLMHGLLPSLCVRLTKIFFI